MPENLRGEVTLREMTADDADLVENYFGRLSEQTVAFFHPHPFDRANAERVAATTAAPNLRIVAVFEGRIVGYAYFEPSRNSEMPTLGIGVSDDFHGKRLGGALMDALAGGAKERGWPGLRLTVFKDNERALRLYLSRGYKIIGDHKGREWLMEMTF